MQRSWFQRGYRRMLVDMHIPDWDSAFLSKYDPAEMVRLYKKAGLTSAMFYAQSHVGLCYWPTTTGKMHEGLSGRDMVGETLTLLREAGIDACAYYSVVYNNWATLEHPEWRLVPASETSESDAQFRGGRYGYCCPNNPGYRAFARAQVEELVRGYDFDGLFIDMTFWPRICICDHCRTRFRNEAGAEFPQIIDWCSPEWCRFQAAREAWMTEFAGALTGWAKEVRAGLSVYHNFATSAFNWTLGLSFEATEANDFLGADFYGDPMEQLVVSKLMNNLSRNRPIEFMTSRCLTLTDHETNKTPDEIRMQAMATTLFSGAMLFIDAIHPDGTANPKPYGMIREVYDEMSRYEPFLGGEPVEDVAIYFSSESKMDFAENGTPLGQAELWAAEYPHKKAVRNVSRVLQQAHVPFGIITRKQLAELDRYKVLVLPNVLRMDAEEVDAVREYVRRGGRLYASRLTSLTETAGIRHEDFMLADVFGCHVEADDAGCVTYVKPRDADLTLAITPQDYLSIMRPWPVPGSPAVGDRANGTLCLGPEVDGDVMATLTRPYTEERGTVSDQNWSSIHSTPPWRDTDIPVIVRHRFGRGRAIYSAVDIECLEGQAGDRVLLHLLRNLLDDRQSASAETHPCVWMSVTNQADRQRLIVAFLNYQRQLPSIPIAEVPFTLRPPQGMQFASLKALPSGDPVKFLTDGNGVLTATVRDLKILEMVAAEYR
jgi:putative glycosyl hydrolase-like family 6 (GHL6) protein/glycosyl hydrolase family 42 (putative beta-galactosidase)